MSDLEIVLSALPRIRAACRSRAVVDPPTGDVLSENQARILGHLDREDPTMVTELAEVMGVTASTMSLNLKRLRESGFVRRERDPEDGRVMNVRLTEAGARVRDAAAELDPGRVDALLTGLHPERRRQAVAGLAILADGADALVSRTTRYLTSLTEGGDPT